jgi:hypothetical protein
VAGRPGEKPGLAVYGWSEMQRDLTEIKALAADLRDRPKRAQK